MKSGELTNTVTAVTGRGRGTIAEYVVELQSGGSVTRGARGRYSGVEMTATDRVNVLLAAALDHPRGEPLASSVKRVRSMSMAPHAYYSPRLSPDDNTCAAFQFVDGLSIRPLNDLGAALDGLVEDMRSGAFDKWAAGAIVNVAVDFHRRDARLLIDRPQFGVSAVFTFGDVDQQESAIERIVRINTDAFRRLATGDTT